MKQKDIALIILIAFISAIAAYFISNAIFAPPQNRQQQVEVVNPITSDFPKPDSAYFNPNAFDPTQPITLGGNANPDPFSSTSSTPSQ
ncbi:MAG TPA: hypothetical protein VHB72_01385 [Candidatus Saccharimonadales bacterium]|nr:hypothetical protein [Candidatus Saccharimonadales bacterium]